MVVTLTGDWVWLPPTTAVLRRPNYPHNCLTLDISDHPKVVEKGILKVGFIFNASKGFGAELLLEDRVHSLSRALQYNRLSYTGPTMMIKDLSSRQYLEFVAKLRQTVFVEEDVTKKCKIYPNNNHTSFDQCDEEEMFMEFKKHNVTPPWVVDKSNLSLVT